MGWFLLPYVIFHFLLLHFPSYTCSLCNHVDNSALLQFKNSFALNTSTSYQFVCSSSLSKTESWENGTDCCQWDGITCEPMSGHVIGVDLSCSCLQGKLHPNSTIFQLSYLQKLNLAFNDFFGSSIYSGIGDLVNLTHLNLSASGITGDIPSTISHLSKLTSLDFSQLDMRLDQTTWNKLILNATNLRQLVLDGIDMSSISFTTNLSSSLVFLRLSGTKLQGNLPSHILCLPNLQELDLSRNEKLKGQLPKSNWSTPLRHLDLSSTAFSGEIPDSIGHVNCLNFLSLYQCKFDGPIPLSFWNLTELTILTLASNSLNGEIPSLLGNIKHLTTFDLSTNNFSGHIPDVFGNFTKLESLDLSDNNLSGQIPSLLFHLTQLKYLFLSNNKLEGPIPSEITKLSKLNTLDLSNNKLNGTIPHWWSSLPLLLELYLNDNQFTGSISVSKSSAYSLEILHLSNNKLQGHFPNSLFEFKNLIELGLSATEMSGLVDFHQFSMLKNLFTLDLSYNSLLSIKIDSTVDYILPNLESLYLSSCNIDKFPKFLEYLANIQQLDLSRNKLEGKIPKWFLEKLMHSWMDIDYFDLSFNKLQGDLPLPHYDTTFFSVSNNYFSGGISSKICNASNLIILNLAHNNLTGKIPQCLGTLPYLKVLDLQMNNLYGSMPRKFSKGSVIETINLNGNRLEGPTPKSLANCKNLKLLDLGDNGIEDTFPCWVETLQELQVLSLRSNKFHGVITCFGTKHLFPMLRVFDVSNNNFSGPLSASYIKNFHGMMDVNDGQAGLNYMGNLNVYNDSVGITIKGLHWELNKILTTFTAIDLSKNMFEGEIPKYIGELNSLRGLNLSHNGISGTIPQSLGDLRSLEWLDLSWNQLAGEIPMALTKLNFLSCLNLSQNQLEGIIPTGRHFDTFGNDSYEGNSMLCGIPLSKSCNIDEERPLHSTFHHQESEFGWKAVAMGYACGMVFGMLLGCNVFLTGKPQCLVKIAEAVLNGRRVNRTNNKSPVKSRGTN